MLHWSTGVVQIDRETQKFWKAQRQQMLQRDRRQRRGWNHGTPVTFTLLGLMILGTLVEMLAPSLLGALSALPGGIWLMLLVSPLLPGGLIGLLFSGLFVWMIGTTIESVARPWQYLLIFFGSGLVGAWLTMLLAGGGGAGLAAFGLAGAYVYSMSHFDQRGAAQWALILLGINVVLAGFQPAILIGEVGTFGVGLAIAAGIRLGGR